MVALPDSSGFVSCSADHDVKFWEWQVAEAAAAGSARQLGARHTRTLKMADDVLCCRVSADGRLLAVALLDSTIQVWCLVCSWRALACVQVVCAQGSGQHILCWSVRKASHRSTSMLL